MHIFSILVFHFIPLRSICRFQNSFISPLKLFRYHSSFFFLPQLKQITTFIFTNFKSNFEFFALTWSRPAFEWVEPNFRTSFSPLFFCPSASFLSNTIYPRPTCCLSLFRVRYSNEANSIETKNWEARLMLAVLPKEKERDKVNFSMVQNWAFAWVGICD